MNKEKDLQFIKDFAKINVSQICKDLGIDRGNVLNNRASAETTNKVRKEIENRLTALME